MKLKTFRGKLGTDKQHTIRLSTADGLTGYRINKFQVIGQEPMGTDQEAVLKVFTFGVFDSSAVPTNTIDFDDPTLIAVAFYENDANTAYFGGTSIVFDSMVFNQDIFITNKASVGNINYYLELEQVKLSKDEATLATLKDMRASE